MPNVQHILSGFIKGRIMKPNWTDFCFRWKGFRIFIRNSELPGFVLFSPPPPPSFGYITCRIDPRVWFQYMTGIQCSNTTQNTRIIHDVWRLLILSNEEKRMIMKKGGVVEKRGEEETKSMPYAPVYKVEKLERICTDWARKRLW